MNKDITVQNTEFCVVMCFLYAVFAGGMGSLTLWLIFSHEQCLETILCGAFTVFSWRLSSVYEQLSVSREK